MFGNSKWIKSPVPSDGGCAEFYRTIKIEKEVADAALTSSVMGMYIPYLNGKRVSGDLYAPGWTQCDSRVQYQTYKISGLQIGENELCILCGEGWAVGQFGLLNNFKHGMSDHISVIYSLDITYADGTKETVISDENTHVRGSQIITSRIYDGDEIDATREKEEFGCALIDDEKKPKLVAQQGEAVREQERLRPVKLFTAPNGERIIDFGQNLAGYVEVKMSAPRGAKVVISHAEVLDHDGNFYTKNLRAAKQQCSYTFAGEGVECFKPMFSWQGFRYIRIDEYPFDDIDISAFKAIAVHSDMKRTGHFECGNPKINQLYHNIIWGQKSNYIDIPTDCPQRDERLGWTGDAQVFVRTAAINYDVERFFKKWLADLALAQLENGGVTGFTPHVNEQSRTFRISAAWGDAAVVCPWEIYLAYGNSEILAQQFDSMKKWIEYMHSAGDEEFLWLGGRHYGDWLAMDGGSEEGLTPHDFIASCYFAHSTSLFIKAGEVLGKDMSEYRELHRNVVNALHERFFEDGVPVCRTQTSYAMTIKFGLCIDEEKTVQGLVDLVKENGGRMNTGFVGTPCLLHALSKGGQNELAYNLLLEEGFPSWLYSVNLGATTMWEHWDGMREDGTMWSEHMNSFNHYAYGAVYDWVFGVCAGIQNIEDGAGYKHVSVCPVTDKRLGSLRASIETRRGKLESAWYYKDDMICFEIEIPEGTTAEIALPNGYTETAGKGRYLYSIPC